MNVLIVDDSSLIRMLVTSYLQTLVQSSDCRVFTASNGADALVIIKSEDIDIVFLDWNMPKINGLDLAKIIKTNEQWKHIIIAMVTSESASYNILEALEIGIEEYLIKPVSQEKIQKTFEKYAHIMQVKEG